MIGVTLVAGKNAARFAAYLTDVASEDEYSVAADGFCGEFPGVWVGLPREEMLEIGVDPEIGVGREGLEALMAGGNPLTGEELWRVCADGARAAAIDMTWALPKSVSAVWACAEPEARTAIEAEWRAAVAEGIDYLGHELEIVQQLDANGDVRHVKADGVLAAVFLHSISRPTGGEEDGVPDPELHAHALLLGARRTDGTMAAIDSREILLAQEELDAIVMGSMAARLERTLGYATERTVDPKGNVTWGLAGVAPELIAAWSRRTVVLTQMGCGAARVRL